MLALMGNVMIRRLNFSVCVIEHVVDAGVDQGFSVAGVTDVLSSTRSVFTHFRHHLTMKL